MSTPQYVVINMDHQAWQAGYAAGLEGRANSRSGYIEGKARRQGFDPEGQEKQALLDAQARPC